MTWSPRFLEALRQHTVAPLLLVESLVLGGRGRADLRLSSFALEGYRELLSPEGSSISHGELRAGSWERSATSLTLGLRGDPRRRTWRGQVVQVRMGFLGWSPGDFEPIFTGQVRQCRYSRGRWTLQLVDLVAGLTSRFNDPGVECLFYRLRSSPLTATLGTTTTTAELVTLSGGYEADDDTGVYLALVEPDSGDEAFWIAASGTSGTTDLTGVGLGNVLDTTRVSAAIGSQVRGAVYLAGHPLEVARRILVSTGTPGRHGSHDTLPESWSYGIPAHLVDHADVDRAIRRTTPATGGVEWYVTETEKQDDGLAWLTAQLAPAGFWLGLHHGLLTCRGVPDYDREPVDAVIGDDDLVELEYDAWDASLPVEYYEVRVETADSGSGRTSTELHVETRPARIRRLIYLPHVHANHVGWGDLVAERTARLYTRIPERITVTLAGWKHAGLSPGDVVQLRTADVSSIYASRGEDFDSRRLLVVGGGPDWFRGTTTLRLLAPVPVEDGP